MHRLQINAIYEWYQIVRMLTLYREYDTYLCPILAWRTKDMTIDAIRALRS